MILRARPPYYPLHDLLMTNTVAPEDSIYIESGYPVGLPVPSDDHNGKLGSNALWNAYGDANTLHLADWIDPTVDASLTLTKLTYTNGGNVLTTGAVVATRGAYLIKGGRFETDDAFLNPIGALISASPLIFSTATVPGRIWVYANEDGDLRVDSVGPLVADSPAADELTIAGLQIDGTGIVTDGAVTPTFVPDYELPVVIDIAMSGTLSASIINADRVVINGGLAGAPALAVDPVTGQSTVEITGNGTEPALVFPVTGGPSILANANGSVAAIAVLHSGSGECLSTAPSGSGVGIRIEHTGTGVGLYADTSGGSDYAIDAVGPAGGDVINASGDTGNVYRALVTSSGVGFRGIGGASAASRTHYGTASHIDAHAVEGATAVGANSGAAGVKGTGNGAGIGVLAEATGTGYGLVALADTTSPARAAMRLTPQDADPTTPLQGDLLFNSARGPTGKLRTRTTQWESVHSSAKGWVKDWGAVASGVTAGGSGNLSLAQITPEETGDVLPWATGHLEFSIDNGSCTISLVDVTGAVTIATQVETSSDPANNVTNLGVTQHSFTIRYPYTLPSTATRTFAVVITANVGTITYKNVVCSVEGVQ